jgi:hypothetical protein
VRLRFHRQFIWPPAASDWGNNFFSLSFFLLRDPLLPWRSLALPHSELGRGPKFLDLSLFLFLSRCLLAWVGSGNECGASKHYLLAIKLHTFGGKRLKKFFLKTEKTCLVE